MITIPITYCYKTEPMQKQRELFHQTRDRAEFGFLWEMGTGKSKLIIDTAGHLYCSKEIDGLILVSDKGCYRSWLKEIDKHLPDHIKRRISVWSSDLRAAEVRAAEELLTPQNDVLDILIVNVEAFSGGRAIKHVESFISSHYCLLCVDEATSIKSYKADRTKTLWRLGVRCDYRRILTGTPITQSPLDLYSMCEFLRPGILGFRSYTAFRSYYAQLKTMILGPRQFQVIVGYQHLDVLTKSIQPFTSRVLKTECLDLPDKVYEVVHVTQSPEQRRHYDNLKQMAILQLDQGLLTSTSAITTINKLQQINCGHIKLDDGTVVDLPSLRMDALIDLLSRIGDKKVVIWCAFQRDVELIMAALKEWRKDGKYAIHYYGKTHEHARPENFDKFTNDPNCLWWVGTASTGGKGIDGLQQVCNFEIYYSTTFNLEDRLQSEDRLHRKGQKWPVTIFDMVCPETVDERIIERQKQKEDLSYEVLDKFKELLS